MHFVIIFLASLSSGVSWPWILFPLSFSSSHFSITTFSVSIVQIFNLSLFTILFPLYFTFNASTIAISVFLTSISPPLSGHLLYLQLFKVLYLSVGVLSTFAISGWGFVRWYFVRWVLIRWRFLRWGFVLDPLFYEQFPTSLNSAIWNDCLAKCFWHLFQM